ncbi:MAG: flagellar biosynthesis protein FlhF [Cellvibrionaceae bacterium]|nr:flagellar biosynthesis protein FlhF [Cellvibrionaceae bacterium]
MTVKRFVAPDMRRALDLVRQEMGPDAIILSSQRTREGVEIITSTDLDVVARGGEERKDFGRRFDTELDQPLASDTAWQAHEGLGEAVRKYAAPAQGNDGKRREQLAREIEEARERMLAAKRGETPRSASRPAPAVPEVTDTVRWQESAKPTRGRSAVAEAPRAAARPAAEPTADYQQPQVSAAHEEMRQSVDRQMAGLQEQVKRLADEQARREKEQEDRRLAALQSELADMRMLMEQQMWRMREQGGAAAAMPMTSPTQDALQAHLGKLGLPAGLVKKLALAAKPGKRINAAWRDALAQLTQQVATDTSDRVQKGGVFAFVGPTGVGKTTTIAKLAARYVLEHGLGKVALITTDTYRVGAHDQLRSLGRILNVPVRVVDQERGLPTVIASLKNYPLILIDTAGFRQGDPLLKEQEALLDSCPGVERILVLACNSQLQTLKASAHAHSGGKLRGCVLTKLDEAGSLGEALGVVIQQKLPVLYCTDGQAIPNDLSVASAAALVAKAVGIMKAQKGSAVAGAV